MHQGQIQKQNLATINGRTEHSQTARGLQITLVRQHRSAAAQMCGRCGCFKTCITLASPMAGHDSHTPRSWRAGRTTQMCSRLL